MEVVPIQAIPVVTQLHFATKLQMPARYVLQTLTAPKEWHAILEPGYVILIPLVTMAAQLLEFAIYRQNGAT